MLKHYAIQSENISVKGEWIKSLLKGSPCPVLTELCNKRGSLFSNVTLEKLIDEELKHDDFSLSGDAGRSARTFSSGEQKKALLKYLIAQKPDFLILDNPFDCLDVQSVQSLKEQLTSLSKNIVIIQLFKRVQDIMPFVTEVLVLNNEAVDNSLSIENFKQQLYSSSEDLFVDDLPTMLGEPYVVTEELVSFKNASVSYDDRCILNNINWAIKRGEFWQLIGPNGSGKTTLLTMIYGDNPKAYGIDLTIFGNKKGSGETVWEIKEKIGYFTPSMTELFNGNHTAENMIISGLVDSIGLYRKATDAQVNLSLHWLELLGLSAKKEVLFYRLSQIEQRMILIARAMIKHPPLLILDEPSTGLDDVHALQMVKLINKIASESETAILYVSHRKEGGLKPQNIFELKIREKGSVGEVIL